MLCPFWQVEEVEDKPLSVLSTRLFAARVRTTMTAALRAKLVKRVR